MGSGKLPICKDLTLKKAQEKMDYDDEKRTTNRQLQLPVKFGSGGFRCVSFRSGCFSALQEIACNPPLLVVSDVLEHFKNCN